MDYTQTNASLRKRCKKLDKFVNCVMYGSDKPPKEAADQAIDPSVRHYYKNKFYISSTFVLRSNTTFLNFVYYKQARENARVPVAGYAELMTPHCEEPSRMVINACTCCVPYNLPSKEERYIFILTNFLKSNF